MIYTSGSKHSYLEYFRMCNLVQRDVKRQNKYIYIYIYIWPNWRKKNSPQKLWEQLKYFFLILRMFWYKISLNKKNWIYIISYCHPLGKRGLEPTIYHTQSSNHYASDAAALKNVRAPICKLQKKMHSIRRRKW